MTMRVVIGRRFLRKCRAILLHGRIEIELSLLPKLHRGGGGERLRDGRQTVKSMRAGGNIVLHVGQSEAVRPLKLSVLDDGDRDPGRMGRGHEFRDGGFDLGVLLAISISRGLAAQQKPERARQRENGDQRRVTVETWYEAFELSAWVAFPNGNLIVATTRSKGL